MRYDERDINLAGRKGATVFLSLKNVTGPFLVMVFDARNDDVLYRRKCINDKVQINVPCCPHSVKLCVIGPADIDDLIIAPLVKNKSLYKFAPDTVRGFDLADMQIEYVDDLGTTPARILVNKGVIQVSKKHFREYDQPTRCFILNHELGHYCFDDEDKADAFALDQCLRMGYNLSSCENALSKVLKKTPENIMRLCKQMIDLKQHSKYAQ